MAKVEFRNKWNKNTYYLVEQNGDKVTMERRDGTTFCIPASYLRESYVRVKDENN